MEKLQFEFVVKASSDGKSNWLALTSITTTAGQMYKLPEQYQEVALHKELVKTAAFKKVKATLTKRHTIRKIWVLLSEELSGAYIDDCGNLQFQDYYLEEITQKDAPESHTEELLIKLLENLSDKSQNKTEKNLKKVAEKFVIEKFTNKNPSVNQWIGIFESECKRLDIQKDEEIIEILRLFLEGSCLDWYSSMLIKLTLDSEWKVWRKNFCETYANKGWSTVKHAISFKYLNGSLLDYALKKERLLLEMNKSIDTSTLINLIASGLPDLVTDRINRDDLKETEDLFTELRSLEHVVKRSVYERKKTEPNQKGRSQERKPCSICEKRGKMNRYHPEESCWFKTTESNRSEKKYEKTYVNSAELEATLEDINPKN